MRGLLRATIVIACLPPLPAAAQEAQPGSALRGQLAVGAGIAPDHDGSDDLRAIPFLLSDVHYRGLTFELRGLRGRIDLAADPRLSIGPVIGAHLDRNDVEGPVGALPEIDLAIEAGSYVAYRFGGDSLGQGAIQTELTLVHDVSRTHDGLIATASVGYTALRRVDTFMLFDVQSSWANADAMRTYFGVIPAGATASGLPAYRPGSGFRDVGMGISAGHYFSRHWGVIGRLGATHLVGDAADSPVTEAGSRWQPVGGIALSYRF